MIRRVAYTVLLSVAAFSLSACGGSGGTTAPETGNVSVVFTDGPTDQYDRILVSMTEMTLIGPGGQVELFNVDGGDPVTFDLLAMREWGDLAFNTEVLTGQYNKIRIQLDAITLEDTSTGDTETIPNLPAGGKIDLNPRGPFEVSADKTTVIKLDIDAEKSFLAVGTGNGAIRFRPIVFVDVFQDEIFLPDRLVRVFGTVDEISGEGESESFRVCNLEFISQAAGPALGESDDCVRVYAEGPIGIFDEEGVEADFLAVDVDDPVTAVGFLADTEDPDAALGLYSVAVALGERATESLAGWGTVKGTVVTETTPADCGSHPCAFDFEIEAGEPPVTISMALKTGVYQADGIELTQQAIGPGDIGSIDAWETDPGEYAAALVVLSPEGGFNAASGTLNAVSPMGTESVEYYILTLSTNTGEVEVCTNGDTDIVQVLADTETAEVLDLVELSELETGMWLVEAYGDDDDVPNPDCAFLADQVIVEEASSP